MKVDDIRQGVESWWDKVHDGWGRLRDSAAGALTRFRADETSRLPAAADIDLPAGSAGGAFGAGWALIGGDVFEDERRLVVRLEVPGMAREDFDIEVQGSELVVRGEKRFEREDTQGRWRVLQCAYGSFVRRVPLPAAVKGEQARAVYREGVLKIELPKAEPQAPRSRTIAVG